MDSGLSPAGGYLYTAIAATSIYPYMEQSSFLKRAIRYFGYQPDILQTDNSAEFTHIQKAERIHPLDILCNQLKICHKRIRPRTPRHNGKVECIRKGDRECFYSSILCRDHHCAM